MLRRTLLLGLITAIGLAAVLPWAIRSATNRKLPVHPAPPPAASKRSLLPVESSANQVLVQSPKAILVGCTEYESKLVKPLRGPRNDVALMRDLLETEFGFEPSSIQSLVEGISPQHRPTRANIVRTMETLIEQAQPDERVILYFAGHGSQQPDQIPADPRDPELDGLDEVFLPADAAAAAGDQRAIQNAIVDDEFRLWCERLLAKRCDLLVIFDSCHSGSALRAAGEEALRQVEPQKLLPAEVIQEATQRPNAAMLNEYPLDTLEQGRWIALYAAQPEEGTLELPLPRDIAGAPHYGLFTYCLCQALRSARGMSYHEWMQRIRAHYLAQGQLYPTPMIEGLDQRRSVLGSASDKNYFLLQRLAKGAWTVQAGQLHGVTQGSILAVRNGSDKSAEPLGYVKVKEAGAAQSRVEACEFADQPASVKLPATGGIAELVYVEYGDQRLKVALATGAADSPQMMTAVRAFQELAAAADSPVKLCAEGEATWLLVPGSAGKLLLVARNANLQSEETPRYELPAKREAAVELFTRIGRATNLLGLAAKFGNQTHSNQLNVELDILHQRASGPLKSLPLDRLPTLIENDTVQFRVANAGHVPSDFTLLFLDSQFGIEPVFPEHEGIADNRLLPGRTWSSDIIPVTVLTVGREHLLLIATPADGATTNFWFLAQPNLNALQVQRGASPFEQLLRAAATAHRSGPGLQLLPNPPVISLRSWIVQPLRK